METTHWEVRNFLPKLRPRWGEESQEASQGVPRARQIFRISWSVPYCSSLATAAKTALKSGGGLLDRLKGLFGGGEKATASFGDVKTVLESAQAPYKGSTVIGHALSKHAGRNSDIWGKVTGSMSTWNEQAMKHLREIARAPGEFKQVTTDKGLTFMEKWLPDGRGVRLNMDGTFKGFID